MIHKISSHDFNNLITETQEKIENIIEDTALIKKNIEKKIKVINYEIKYLSNRIEKLEGLRNKDSNYVLLNNDMNGVYSNYNNNIHAYFKKQPKNLFNIQPINSETMFFKDIATVSINGVTSDEYKNILKHDNIVDKEIFFEEYGYQQEDKVTAGTAYLNEEGKIAISINVNRDTLYGQSKFNLIELDPYLMCSFDIEKIDIYDSNIKIPDTTITDIKKVSCTRIILNKKYDFKRIDIIIKPRYSTLLGEETIVPFGLKHIYLYDADFRDDSYIEVCYTSDKYIDYIMNSIKIYSSTGEYSTTLTEQGIKIYLDKINNVLVNEQEPTNLVKKRISRNIKTIYFKIPLGQNENQVTYNNSIYGIRFNIYNRLT